MESFRTFLYEKKKRLSQGSDADEVLKKLLKKFKVNSVNDLNPAQKKKFFDRLGKIVK